MKYKQVKTFDETTEVAKKKEVSMKESSTINCVIHGESN
jgi:hypothetical protein